MRSWSAPVRYAECDGQGVVFNSHYLLYADEALTGMLRALGTPKSGREAARADDAALLKRIYCEEVLETAGGLAALDELAALAGKAPTCLLCFERDPARCHRRLLAERLAPRGFAVEDLFG